MRRSILVFTGLAIISASAYSQIALSGGTYFAKSAAVRSVFGDKPFTFGFGLGGSDRANRDGPGFDAVALSLDVSGNRFQLIGGTFGIEKQFGEPGSTRTYIRAGTGLAYYNYRFTSALLGGPSSGTSFRSISTVEAGLILSRNLTISAQYLHMPKINSVDFSGFRVQAAFSFGGR